MKQGKSCISSSFGMELISGGGFWLPRILLRNYSSLGITNQEMLLLIHLLSVASSEPCSFPLGEIAKFMDVPPQEVSALLESLLVKGVLCGASPTEYVVDENIVLQPEIFSGLFDKIFELWGCQQAQKIQMQQNLAGTQEAKAPGISKVVSNLYRCFEKEFGRPLSPIESSQIMEWYYGDKYSFELILEALKRAVLRGVVNFKYIDSILHGWNKNNLKTVRAVLAHEEAFSERKKGKKKVKSDADGDELNKKYKDIYLS